jgi:hypothetical protein
MHNFRHVGKIILSAAILLLLFMSGATVYAAATGNPASQSLFTAQTPASLGQSDGAGVNYELGTLLQSNTAGQITAVRFWKDASESGTHTGNIWSSSGKLLATVTFANETPSGWQLQNLTAPISIAANTTYVVSVNTGNTFYVATTGGLSSPVVSGNLSTVAGNNGVYGNPGTFPTNSWQNSNYFRDVVFAPGVTSGSPTVAPTITTQPTSQTVMVGQTATFSVTATGTAPMSYQWQKNGTAISGATSPTYTTPPAVATGTGARFAATVTNSAGSVTSSGATLTIGAATLLLNSNTSALSFGNVNMSSATSQNVTLTNGGNSSVTISNVSISGAGYGASGVPAGLILSAGQTATLDVTFDPSATGSMTGSVTVTSNATNSPDKITLSGTGVAAVAHSASLSWTPSTSTVVGYNCYASTVSGGPYTKLTAQPVATTTCKDTTVQAGMTYYFVVTSINASGVESVYSSQISAAIP